jgi:hypothetical protein
MRFLSTYLLAAAWVLSTTLSLGQARKGIKKGAIAAKVAAAKTEGADGLPKGVTPYIQKEEGGQINWTGQYIEAEGEGIIDNERFKNPAQARALAIRGATVVAQRNLLEIVKGVTVTSETTVEDMITTKDLITTKIEGVVKGAQMVGQPVIADGSVKVRLRMPLYAEGGLAPAIYDDIPKPAPAPGPAPVQQDSAKMDSVKPTPAADKLNLPTNLPDKGIVFNTKGQPFDPSLFPVVTDSTGKVLLDMSKIYDPSKGKFPVVVNATKEALQALGLKKGVQILDVLSAKDGKIVVSNQSSGKINWGKIVNTLQTIGKFLLMLL